MEQCSSSLTVGAASSDEEDNGVQGVLRKEDHTLRRSKSSPLDAGMRELAGLPGVPLPNTSVQRLAERNSEELLEELGRLTAELNHRLELQKQKACLLYTSPSPRD